LRPSTTTWRRSLASSWPAACRDTPRDTLVAADTSGWRRAVVRARDGGLHLAAPRRAHAPRAVGPRRPSPPRLHSGLALSPGRTAALRRPFGAGDLVAPAHLSPCPVRARLLGIAGHAGAARGARPRADG